MKPIAVLLFLILAMPARAAFPDPRQKVNRAARIKNAAGSTTLIDAAALSAAPSVELDTEAYWSKLVLFVAFTRSAATTVAVTVECSPDTVGSATYYTRQVSLQRADGGVILKDRGPISKPVTASTNFPIEADIAGCQSVRLTWGGDDATSGDLITVRGSGVAGN